MFAASDTPSAGTAASVTTHYAEGLPLVKTNAKLIQAAAVACPLSLGILATRSLIVERVSPAGDVVSITSYVMPNTGGNDRHLSFSVDVAAYPGKAVRARIDGCAAGETQWVVINYEFE